MRILTEPKNALVKQYQKLLEYDMVELDFDTQALEAAADRAIERGIGARGLRAVLELSLIHISKSGASGSLAARWTPSAWRRCFWTSTAPASWET